MSSEIINRPNSIIKISWNDNEKNFIVTKTSNMNKLIYNVKIAMDDLRNDYTITGIPKSDKIAVDDSINILIRRLFI